MPEWDRTHHDDAFTFTEQQQRGRSPGKSTLTSRLGGGVNAAQLERLVMRVMRKTSGSEVSETAKRSIAHAQTSNGTTMPAETQAQFAQCLGIDLDNVRIHTDAAAAEAASSVGAKAYTMGNDIYFGEGQYDPGSLAGKELLAHEVVHTVQQATGAAGGRQNKLETSEPGDALEREADEVAASMVRGQATSVSAAPGLLARRVMRRVTSVGGIAVRNAIRGAQGSSEIGQILQGIEAAQQQSGDTVQVRVPGETVPVRRAELAELLVEARSVRGEAAPPSELRPPPTNGTEPLLEAPPESDTVPSGELQPPPTNETDPQTFRYSDGTPFRVGPNPPRELRPPPTNGTGALLEAPECDTAPRTEAQTFQYPDGTPFRTWPNPNPPSRELRPPPTNGTGALLEAPPECDTAPPTNGTEPLIEGTEPLIEAPLDHETEAAEDQAAADQSAMNSLTRSPGSQLTPVNWSDDPARPGPVSPPDLNLSVDQLPTIPAAAGRATCTTASPRRDETQPRTPLAGTEPAQNEAGEPTEIDRQDWAAYAAVVEQLQQSWNSMSPHVQQYNVTSPEAAQELQELGVAGRGDGDMGNRVEAQQQASDQDNPITVGELFDGEDGQLNLGRGGERGVRQAQSSVRGSNMRVLSTDHELDGAMETAEAATTRIEQQAHLVEAALSANRQTDRQTDIDGAVASLARTETSVARVTEIISQITRIARLAISRTGSTGDQREQANMAQFLAQSFASAIYASQLSAQRAALSEAEDALAAEIDRGRQERYRAAVSGLDGALQEREAARSAVSGALTSRRASYSDLGDAAGRGSGTTGETRDRIRQTVASSPLIELTLSRIHAVLNAIDVPAYNVSAGRGLAMAYAQNHPSTGPFRGAISQLKGYQEQFEAHFEVWEARHRQCQTQVDTLRGND